LSSVRGNIVVSFNTKHDVFQEDGTRVGGWSVLYGAGFLGNVYAYIDANSGGIGGSFAQEYPGIGNRVGTSAATSLTLDYADYQGTTSGPTAGAGGGDYHIGASSVARGIVTNPPLRFDLDGVTRATTADAGAYEYVA
jgi:hypothetical protein